MSYLGAVKDDGGPLVVLGVGIGLLAMHVRHAIGDGEDFQTFLFGILIPMAFAVGVVIGGVWLWRQNISSGHLLSITAWCLIGTVVLAAGAMLLILYQEAEGVNVSDQLYLVVNSASGGGVVGLVIGLYEYRQRSAQATADQLNRQLTVLNRVLRHDIRNGANVIHGRAEVLAENETDVAEQADTIQQQAVALVRLSDHAKEIEQLLHADRVEPTAVDISSTVDSCCEQTRRDHPEAEIDVSLAETEPVSAHPLINSALTNVIKNAIEHNDKETPRVDVRSERVSHDGTEYVELRVADNGPGIPESELAVFDRGYETELEHAAGLGLWLVNWIVTASNGEVAFETNDPEGSVVSLRFEPAEPDTLEGSPGQNAVVHPE